MRTISPRTGRPPKVDAKHEKITIRLNEKTLERLQWCADKLGVTRTQVIEKGIDKVEAEIKK